jgi:hypothetical protein
MVRTVTTDVAHAGGPVYRPGRDNRASRTLGVNQFTTVDDRLLDVPASVDTSPRVDAAGISSHGRPAGVQLAVWPTAAIASCRCAKDYVGKNLRDPRSAAGVNVCRPTPEWVSSPDDRHQ